MDNVWFLFVLAGMIGWIFWLKELLKNINAGKFKVAQTDNFETTTLSQQFGKLRFLKVKWKQTEYFIATDIQTGNLTVIDKTNLKEDSNA